MKRIVFGKSITGASHVRAGISCQDYCNYLICEDDAIILAVADGHGSKASPFSSSGSQIAVNVFLTVVKKFHDAYLRNPDKLLTYLNREGNTKIAQTIDAEWKRRVLRSYSRKKRKKLRTDTESEDESGIYIQYGTTLIGLMLTTSYYFAFQLGDGDICYVDDYRHEMILNPEKILGVETHSLSKKGSWVNAYTLVRRNDNSVTAPSLFLLSTDGFSNSFRDNQEYHKTCVEYFGMIKQHGTNVVETNLKNWLTETSELGCGDDITLLMAYTHAVCSDKAVCRQIEDATSKNMESVNAEI